MNCRARATVADRTLDEANELADVVRLRDEAEAIRVVADSARYGAKFQNLAAAFKLKAERKAGELLAGLERNQGGPTKFGAVPDSVSGTDERPVSEYRRALDEVKVDERQARRWQQIAAIPLPLFEEYVTKTDAESAELTRAGTDPALAIREALGVDARGGSTPPLPRRPRGSRCALGP